jgi:DNA-binding NarL/FixJ family response regulator
MPQLTGLQVLELLRRIKPDVRVIISSGHVIGSDADRLVAAGARAFVAKPYRPEELVERVRQVLDEPTPVDNVCPAVSESVAR